MRRFVGDGSIGALVAAAPFAAPALAQSYPDRPIRILVAFPPGGAADLVARVVGQALSVRLGQPVVVENRPGSNGNVAGDLVAHAPPDGYTLLLGGSALFAINPHLYAKMPIDPLQDLVPVASLVANALLLTENPALTPTTFAEFIAFARNAKPPLLYGSIGNGSEHHLAMELLKQQAGMQMTHVPYRGGGRAAIGVMGGEVAAIFGGGSVATLVQSGKLRAPCHQRPQALAGIRRPAVDFGILSDLRRDAVAGPIRAARHAAGDRRAAAPEANAALAPSRRSPPSSPPPDSGEPYVSTLEEFSARIRSDNERYGNIIASSGIRVE